VDGSDVYRLAGRPDRSAVIPPVPPTTMTPPRVAAVTDVTAPAAPAESRTSPVAADRPESG